MYSTKENNCWKGALSIASTDGCSLIFTSLNEEFDDKESFPR